jgi:methyltransferase (TIGR00027 family)
MELWIAVRTAFLDDEVRKTTAPQVVILGAGLDTRAARLARPGLRCFEVDRPDTQADKRARLSALAGYPTFAATYVGCDFEQDDFLERLQAAGFAAGEPALVLWEGVTYYLSEPAVRATLRRVAHGCHPDTTLVFDSIQRRLIDAQRITDEQRQMLDHLDALGEPFRFGINDLVPLLYEEGFRHVRTVSFDEACLSLTGSYARERQFRFQRFTLASRRPPPRP